MPLSFLHPDLMKELARFGDASPYPNIVTVQTSTRTYNSATNEPIETLSDDVTMQNLSAYIEPIDSRKEIRRSDQTVVENGWYISIAGFYDITVNNTIIDDFDNGYNVLHVDHDAFKTQTVLTCEIINTALTIE